jgi:hypothetical protein
MRHTRSRSAGFTLLEIVVSVAASAVGMGAMVALWGATDGLSDASRTAMRGESEHRANLTTVATLFRDVAPASLGGFDADGRATSPSFRRVTGLDGTTPELGPEQTVAWSAVSAWGQDDQGAALGQLVLRETGAPDRVLARQVPQGGFVVTRLGRSITVSLATFHRSSESTSFQRTHDTLEICLRN